MGSGLATLNLTTKPCFDSLPTHPDYIEAVRGRMRLSRKRVVPQVPTKAMLLATQLIFHFRYPVAEYASIRKFLRMDSTIKPVTLISFAHM